MRFVQYNRPFFTKEQQTLLTITVLNNLLTVQPKHHLGKVEISKSKILWSLDGIWVNLGKLQYFTNLNLAAIKGDDFPNINHDFQGSGEQWGRDEIYPDISYGPVLYFSSGLVVQLPGTRTIVFRMRPTFSLPEQHDVTKDYTYNI